MRWINTRPSRGSQLALTLLPFVLLIVAYAFGSAARLAENANDKLLPGFADFADAINRLVFVADPRTGEYLLWSDTAASLVRLFAGLGISTVTALVIGMLIGMLPYLRALLSPSSPLSRWCRRWRYYRFSSSPWGLGKPLRSRSSPSALPRR